MRFASLVSALTAALSGLALGAAAHAAPVLKPTSTPVGDVSFQAVSRLHQTGGNIAPQLRHGVPADPKVWPASLYGTFQSAEGPAYCTAALVGPGTMLTAAHCVPTAGVMTLGLLPFEPPGDPAQHTDAHAATCTANPQYPGDLSADWALCTITPAIRGAPTDFRYETIEARPLNTFTTPPPPPPLILAGYGCKSDLVHDGATGVPTYEIGTNTVEATSLSTTHPYGGALYNPAQRNNLFTTPWGANVCPGDSGGPVFRITGSSSQPYAHRSIVAVNSRVFYADETATTYGASILVATGGPDFPTWARKWAQDNGVEVCGVWPSPRPAYCRN